MSTNPFSFRRYLADPSRRRGSSRTVSANRNGLLQVETLEQRRLLHGDDLSDPDYDLTDHVHYDLTIIVNGQHVPIPANIGVDATSILTFTHTHVADSRIHVHPVTAGVPTDFETVGDFFDVWRTETRSLAGTNAGATFSETELMGVPVDATHEVRMYVNGERSFAFEDYKPDDEDDVVLVYTQKSAPPSVVLTRFETNRGDLDIELLRAAAPQSVDNFLNYVNGDDYFRSILHRGVPGFIIQFGGFTIDGVGGYGRVPTDPPVVNEFNISNTERTIAYAKLGSDPDSATSQIFVNTSDNASNLDSQNGGFTVFGRLVNGTYAVAQQMEAIPTHNAQNVNALLGTAFTDLPIVGFPSDPNPGFPRRPHPDINGPGDVDQNDLVVVLDALVVPTAMIRGTKFEDLDGDGVQDAGESGLGGWTIYLDTNDNGILDAGETSTVTESDGHYQFADLPSGTHVVREVLQNGWVQTAPGGEKHTIALADGDAAIDVDFGNLLSSLDPPVAVADQYAVDEDDSLTVNAAAGVLLNDNDPESEPLTAELVSGAANGVLSLSPDGSFTYTPSADFSGQDSFTYRARAGGRASTAVNVTINVNPMNDAPVLAQPPDVELNKNTSVHPGAIDLRDLVTDPDSDPATMQFRITNLAEIEAALGLSDGANGGVAGIPVVTIGMDPDSGMFKARPAGGGQDNTIHVHPRLNSFGAVPVRIEARDAQGAVSAVRTFNVTVIDVNSPPAAADDTANVDEDQQVTVAVLGNDVDFDGTIDPTSIQIVTPPPSGLANVDGLGNIVYQPKPNFFGTDEFTYLVRDDRGAASSAATVRVTVNPTQDAPTAAADTYAVDEDTTLAPVAADGVLANDVDVDGDTLTAVLDSPPAHGQLTLAADGSFSYTPDANYHGPDSFTYHAFDGLDVSNTVTVDLTVRPVNDPPVAAVDGPYTVAEDTTLAVSAAAGLLPNDTDIEGDPLTAVLAEQAAHGTVTLHSDGSFTYRGDADFNGTDRFTYQAHDGQNGSAAVEVIVNVTPVDDPPTILPVAKQTAFSGIPFVLDLTAVDPDNSGDAIQFTLDPGAPGGATIDPLAGRFQWTPTVDDLGNTAVTVRATRASDTSLTSTINFAIAVFPPVILPIGGGANLGDVSFSGPLPPPRPAFNRNLFTLRPSSATTVLDPIGISTTSSGIASGQIGPQTGVAQIPKTTTGPDAEGGDEDQSDGDAKKKQKKKQSPEDELKDLPEGEGARGPAKSPEDEALSEFDPDGETMPPESWAELASSRRTDPTAAASVVAAADHRLPLAEPLALPRPTTPREAPRLKVAGVARSGSGNMAVTTRTNAGEGSQRTNPALADAVWAGLAMPLPRLVTDVRRQRLGEFLHWPMD